MCVGFETARTNETLPSGDQRSARYTVGPEIAVHSSLFADAIHEPSLGKNVVEVASFLDSDARPNLGGQLRDLVAGGSRMQPCPLDLHLQGPDHDVGEFEPAGVADVLSVDGSICDKVNELP